jgi:hypothetical protein
MQKETREEIREENQKEIGEGQGQTFSPSSIYPLVLFMGSGLHIKNNRVKIFT